MLRAYVVLVLLGVGCRPVSPKAPASPTPVAAPEPSTSAVGPRSAPRGKMTKEKLRSVVRASIPDVKRCYNEGLARDPDLTGRVKYQFTITPDGSVAAVSLASSDLPGWARSVEKCIAAVVSALTFPEPPGGTVVVTYPFVLVPGVARWNPVAGQPPRTAVVGVRDDRNKPVEGAIVTLVFETPLRRQKMSGVTDAHGVAIFSGLPAVGTVIAVVGGVVSETAALRRPAMGVTLRIATPEAP